MMRWRQAPFSGMALGEGIHSVVGLAISGFLFLTGPGPVDLLAFLVTLLAGGVLGAMVGGACSLAGSWRRGAAVGGAITALFSGLTLLVFAVNPGQRAIDGGMVISLGLAIGGASLYGGLLGLLQTRATGYSGLLVRFLSGGLAGMVLAAWGGFLLNFVLLVHIFPSRYLEAILFFNSTHALLALVTGGLALTILRPLGLHSR